MPISKDGNGVVQETAPADLAQALRTGVWKSTDLAVSDPSDHLKQICFDPSNLATNTTVTLQARASASGVVQIPEFQTSTFTMTFDNTIGDISITATKIGNVVTLHIPSIILGVVGEGVESIESTTQLPTEYRPALSDPRAGLFFPAVVQNDSNVVGALFISDIIAFSPSVTGSVAFTAGAAVGLIETCITYLTA